MSRDWQRQDRTCLSDCHRLKLRVGLDARAPPTADPELHHGDMDDEDDAIQDDEGQRGTIA